MFLSVEDFSEPVHDHFSEDAATDQTEVIDELFEVAELFFESFGKVPIGMDVDTLPLLDDFGVEDGLL